MPATFQKTIDKTLQNIKTKFAYLDEILVITKGNLQDHETELDKIMKQLNEENLAIYLQKGEFAKPEITWLGFKVTPNGVTPSKPKCEAILALDPPKTPDAKHRPPRRLCCSIRLRKEKSTGSISVLKNRHQICLQPNPSR